MSEITNRSVFPCLEFNTNDHVGDLSNTLII